MYPGARQGYNPWGQEESDTTECRNTVSYLMVHTLVAKDSAFALQIQNSAIKQEKKSTEDFQNRKEEIKLPVFANDLVVYAEIPKKSAGKFLELVSLARFQHIQIVYTISCISVYQQWNYVKTG